MARAVRTGRRISSTQPIVTWSIMAITAVVFLLQVVSGGTVSFWLTYHPQLTGIMPWTMITSISRACLVHPPRVEHADAVDARADG